MNPLIGRVEEQRILGQKKNSSKAELIAVLGRRRVGKTFLVRNYFQKDLVFEITGIHNATLKNQLQNFTIAMQKATKSPILSAIPANWLEAFTILDSFIDNLPKNKPAVVFLDEFPWLHSHKSNFLQAFDHWWNSAASKKSHIKVVICGSAASWMIDKVVAAKGGLHNRVTQTIRLLPFSLAETDAYLKNQHITLKRYQVLQIYMATGGIPHYLQHITPGESVPQAIDRLFFTKDGPLRVEFSLLYDSLFDHSSQHEAVIRVLAKKGAGLTRQEIIDETSLTSGGGMSRVLKELEESGFIMPYIPFQKTVNESIYKLSDEYSLFYLKFIEGAKAMGAGSWLSQFATASYLSWSGFAFESVCQKHTGQIKTAVGIAAGVKTGISTWRYSPPRVSKIKGAQIDLLLDRNDGIINLCEMKFSKGEFVIDKSYSEELDNKVQVFQRETRVKSTIFPTMITTYGVKKNSYYKGRVQNEVVMDDLFK
ncbi:MAG: ATP-binding protein [Chitinophagaceae bacterium]|nr:MAG: ATP-binding protein [Chitinophagaceae bacterium]